MKLSAQEINWQAKSLLNVSRLGLFSRVLNNEQLEKLWEYFRPSIELLCNQYCCRGELAQKMLIVDSLAGALSNQQLI